MQVGTAAPQSSSGVGPTATLHRFGSRADEYSSRVDDAGEHHSVRAWDPMGGHHADGGKPLQDLRHHRDVPCDPPQGRLHKQGHRLRQVPRRGRCPPRRELQQPGCDGPARNLRRVCTSPNYILLLVLLIIIITIVRIIGAAK